MLCESQTPVMPKSNNSINKSPNRSKKQISDKMAPEQGTADYLRKFTCGNDSFKVFHCRSNLYHAKKLKTLRDISAL